VQRPDIVKRLLGFGFSLAIGNSVMASVGKISIIMPAYNAAEHLPAAIASVLAQTLTDWEMIIVNDGSIDSTAAFLDGLDDPRIRVIHQPNGGVSAARNTALDAARGRYVTFLDADDRLPPDALEIRTRYLDDHATVDIVNGGVEVIQGHECIRRYLPDLGERPLIDSLARLEEGVFFGACYMLRRDRIGGHRFPVGLSHCEDLIFFLTLAQSAGLRYGAVADPVYEYRINPRSAMSNLDGIEAGYLELLRVTARLGGIDDATRQHQLRRIRRILFRSWLRRKRPIRALQAVFRIHRAVAQDLA
jgi:glycosyltransferase involved in cell wall biosynthesis